MSGGHKDNKGPQARQAPASRTGASLQVNWPSGFRTVEVVAPGDKVDLTGNFFQAGERVMIYNYRGGLKGGEPPPKVVWAETTVAGEFAWLGFFGLRDVAVPANLVAVGMKWTKGQLYAEGDKGSFAAYDLQFASHPSDKFRAAPPQIIVTPRALQLSLYNILPPLVRNGDEIVVYGAGFQPGEIVELYIANQWLGAAEVKAGGVFWVSLQVPGKTVIEPGFVYPIVAVGRYGSTATYLITVTKD